MLPKFTLRQALPRKIGPADAKRRNFYEAFTLLTGGHKTNCENPGSATTATATTATTTSTTTTSTTTATTTAFETRRKIRSEQIQGQPSLLNIELWMETGPNF